MQRTKTTHLGIFQRASPTAVIYDLSQPDVVTITLPAGSQWTSGLHWHEAHTEYFQVIQGAALVTLGQQTQQCSPVNGPIEVPKGTTHEWRRIDSKADDSDVVVKEWTIPADGHKEVFFRMLNSFLIEPQPQKLYHAPFPESTAALLRPLLDRWIVLLQLFTIFQTWDNWPVFLGTNNGWLSWGLTHILLFFSSWVGTILGIRGSYEEYVSHDLAGRVARAGAGAEARLKQS